MILTAPEYRYLPNTEASVFLAGGITNCPNWQDEAIEMLNDTGLTILNPRRPDFDVTDPNAESEQIKWEHHYLCTADFILFWFPAETLCPITLFEYGRWIAPQASRDMFQRFSGFKPLFVGTHPDYARRRDVVIQGQLERGDFFSVWDKLEDVCDELMGFYDEEW